ncbi:MAG: addiction module protein [Melioribacteraceae bacterium]
MESNIREQIKKLSVSERIILVEEIWDDIAEENTPLELSDEQKQEIERRSKELKTNPDLGKSWEAVRTESLGK